MMIYHDNISQNMQCIYNKPAKMTSPSLWSYDQKIEREKKISKTLFINSLGVRGLWCLMPLSTIFQLCRGDVFKSLVMIS